MHDTKASEPQLISFSGASTKVRAKLMAGVKAQLGHQVEVLPDAANLVLGTCFSTASTKAARRAAVRALFQVQREMESAAVEARRSRFVLTSGGTPEWLAHWPGDPAEYWLQVGAERSDELARYALVVHQAASTQPDGSPRKWDETTLATAALDARLEVVWSGHPDRIMVPGNLEYKDQIARLLARLDADGSGRRGEPRLTGRQAAAMTLRRAG